PACGCGSPMAPGPSGTRSSGSRPWWVCWCRHRVAGRCAASPPLPARPPRSSPGARRSKVVSVSPSVTPRGWVARTTRLRLRCSSAWVTSCQCPRRARQESCTHSGSSRLSPARTIPRVSRSGPAPATPWPSPGPPAESARVIWTRTGWSVRGERRVELPDGVRHLHLRVDLQPRALLVRGALVVVLDAVLLGAVWLASLLLVDGGRPRLPPVLAALRTSYRVRLTATLAGFFVVPVMAFALWSFAQLRDDARQDGDLLIRQT